MPETTLEKAQRVKDLRSQLAYNALPLTSLLPHQTPPLGDWEGWLIQAGRGTGKTAGLAKYMTDHVNGPPCIKGSMPHKMALIAPTVGDAVESADRHPVCLRSLAPGAKLQVKPGGTILTWPNGSEVKLFGVHTRDDVERLRAGGNNCLVWAEELATWRYIEDGWDQMQFGLRIGPNPHWVGSSTPKNRAKYREIALDPHVVVTRAHTDDNPYLESSFRNRLDRMFGGTTKARQEMGGELLDEADGAPWKRIWIDAHRMREKGPLGQVVVGVDPQGSAETGTTGIVAAGRTVGSCPCGVNQDRLPHAFVLEDHSIAATPDGWARRTVAAFDITEADHIAAERNFGYDMVEATIRTVWPSAPLQLVHASRGKVIRAEPVAALYEQGRVHHVGSFPELEDEMTTWTVDEPWSPNRLDALVWAITQLGLTQSREAKVYSAAGRTMNLGG